jgi:hypothetical protein
VSALYADNDSWGAGAFHPSCRQADAPQALDEPVDDARNLQASPDQIAGAAGEIRHLCPDGIT